MHDFVDTSMTNDIHTLTNTQREGEGQADIMQDLPLCYLQIYFQHLTSYAEYVCNLGSLISVTEEGVDSEKKSYMNSAN